MFIWGHFYRVAEEDFGVVGTARLVTYVTAWRIWP